MIKKNVVSSGGRYSQDPCGSNILRNPGEGKDD